MIKCGTIENGYAMCECTHFDKFIIVPHINYETLRKTFQKILLDKL